jgi:hypothetical protein
MKRFIAVAGAVLIGSVVSSQVASGASGGGQPTFHFHQDIRDVEPDYCGTGKTVIVEGRVNAISWVAQNGPYVEEVKVDFNARATITNPANGAFVIDSQAAQYNNRFTGVQDGQQVFEEVVHGVPEKLQSSNGRLLARDAGTLTYRLFFDPNTQSVTGLEIVDVSGPHEGFNTDRRCQIIISELGL